MRAAVANKYKIRLMFYLAVITVSLGASFVVFVTVVRPVFMQRLQYYTHMAATETINNAVSDVFSGENSFGELVTLERNSDGTVTALSANTAEMNRLRAAVAGALEENLKKTDARYINIPIGSILGNELLAGSGPDVKIKIRPIGLADIDFYDNFESCGINQSRHTIYIVVAIDIAVTAPQMKTSNRVSAKIPVSETVIVGNVPKYYGAGMNTAVNE